MSDKLFKVPADWEVKINEKKAFYLSRVYKFSDFEKSLGFINKVSNIAEEDGKVNEEATDWIEEVTAGCINMPIIKAGKRTRYLEEFKKICLQQKEIEDEN